MLAEVEADREVLVDLTERVAGGPGKMKRTAGWIGERMSKAKLGRRVAGELGTLESLEVLALGVLGKRALWRSLAEIAPADPRLEGLDLDQLLARAEAQHARLEEQRLEAARTVLRAPGDPSG